MSFRTMTYTPIIGLEVHVQLLTHSKIFCGCVNRFNPDEPNTQTCPVCLGLPGSLPVMNAEAFRLSVVTALALNCEIAPFTKWDRKQYFSPDLPKGYQISQYDLPFSHDGWVDVQVGDAEPRRIRIRRAHLEEDAGKNLHDESGRGGDSQVDLNRAGTPLLEIVTEPDVTTAVEARTFLEELHLLLTYLGVSDCNMQEGSLRCDANVNLMVTQPDGLQVATPIVEVKNLNSFRGVETAIDYELWRQQEEFEKTGIKLGDTGGEKQTRGFNADRGTTFAQRGKEEASDYRYFPDPDLVPVTLSVAQVDEVRGTLCELPANRRDRFQSQLGLTPYDAGVIITQGRSFADYFEAVAQTCGDVKQAANWTTQDVLRELNERRLAIADFPVNSDMLGTLLSRVVSGAITVKSGRELFTALLARVDEGQSPTTADIDPLIDELGLKAVTGGDELTGILDAIIADSPKAVEDFKAGKQQAIGQLIGKVMKQLKGADAKAVREQLIARLSS
ncbi:MAG: Asp-tRNA(Asn)/Glu-tRNA(Gln) amidotransferase subunit GatB [Planctomycetaceae bacterium]